MEKRNKNPRFETPTIRAHRAFLSLQTQAQKKSHAPQGTLLWFCYKKDVLCPYPKKLGSKQVSVKSPARVYKGLGNVSEAFFGEEPQTSTTGDISA
ncbi:hypothetical protein [uncultured Neglectibacter sp.]|uniref:hypothetical protein n=1 Tax=uncultured Neglectibacter sp. TaxID=1924108 RepID=UPI0034DF4592